MIVGFILLCRLWPSHERQLSFRLPAILRTSFSSVHRLLSLRRATPHIVLLATVHICTCSSRQDSNEPQYNEYSYNWVHYSSFFSIFAMRLSMLCPMINTMKAIQPSNPMMRTRDISIKASLISFFLLYKFHPLDTRTMVPRF